MKATLAEHEPSPSDDAARVDEPWRNRLQPLITAGNGGWLVTLAVGLLAGLLRFLRLDLPTGQIFDEIYYACDSQHLVRFGVERGTQAGSACIPNRQPGLLLPPPAA